MKEVHIMLDIETLSANTNTVVLSIGAARFDIKTGTVEKSRQWNISDLEAQQAKGREITADTVKWWLKRSPAAIEGTFFAPKTYTTKQALEEFVFFCKIDTLEQRKIFIWGNGNMFDNAIIRSLCKDFGVEYPCPYPNDLDLRTVKFLFRDKKVESIKSGTAHNAVDDAINQAQYLGKLINS